MPLFVCWRSTNATLLCILLSDFLQDGWMPASQPSSSTSAVNQLNSCMLFQCPSYWGSFLVQVGDTGTIPFEMRRESAYFPGASCDKTQSGSDRCRWWYVNSWALSWRTKQYALRQQKMRHQRQGPFLYA